MPIAKKKYQKADVIANIYQPAVLIGNWFEERFSDKSDRHAITPGIYGKSGCISSVSLYKHDYIQPVPDKSSQAAQDFINWKQEGFSNRLNAVGTNIKLWDGDAFNKNITTIHDIMYRILPAKDTRMGEHVLKKQPRLDLLGGYGNSTKTGLLPWRACLTYQEKHTPIDLSHYKQVYKKPPYQPNPCPIRRPPQRKTSII